VIKMGVIERLREYVDGWGKGSIEKDKRYHVYVKGFVGLGIHCSYIEDVDDNLRLMDSRNKVIAVVKYDDVEMVDICKDNFWDVICNVYAKDLSIDDDITHNTSTDEETSYFKSLTKENIREDYIRDTINRNRVRHESKYKKESE